MDGPQLWLPHLWWALLPNALSAHGRIAPLHVHHRPSCNGYIDSLLQLACESSMAHL